MDLKKFLPGQPTEPDAEYFWAVVIEPGWVQAGVWRIANGSAQVLYTSTPNSWELESELVSATDISLSNAVKHFPDSIPDPSKTVFGVISSWVSGGEIKVEYLAQIKKLCGDLSLKPVGFVVIPEAISYLIKSEEGSVVNAVFLGVYKETLEVAVFNLGNLMGATSVARSLSIVDDVIEGLARFAGREALPARFVLYNARESELSECRQELTQHNWEETKTLNFLHTPKAEIISPDKKVYAVSLAGAAEIANVESLVSAPVNEPAEDVGTETLSDSVPEAFSQEQNPDSNVTEATPEEFGFTSDDSAVEIEEAPANNLNETLENLSKVSDTEEAELIGNDPKAEKSSFFQKFLTKLPVFSKPRFNFKKPGVSREGKKSLIAGIVVLVLITITFFALWWYLPSATAIIYISPQRLDERIEVTASPEVQELNVENRLLPAEKLTVSVSGEKTKSTTGTKTVGDKAKGEVTLYRVGTSLTIPSGTALHGPENLEFVLDEEVAIASGSAGSPGTAKVGVTADDIGADYNLASGTTFRVGNYSNSDIEAKNEESFSGGSSKEINAVSEADREALLSELEEELREKAITELKGKISGDTYLIEDSLSVDKADEEFSAKVGDEANSLTLSLGAEGSALSVERSRLTELLSEVLKSKVPSGYVLRGDQIESDFKVKEESGEGYVFETEVDANLLPQIDTDEIGRKIAGKYKSVAEEFIKKELPGFVRAEITINPKLPGRLGTLPHIAKRIDVQLSADR